MKRTFVVLVLAAFSVLLASAPPETMTIDGCGDKKGAVAFPHQAHVDAVADCATCHHTDEGLTADNAGEVQSCRACHLDPAEEATPSCSEMSLKKNPFHAGCIDCHKTEAKGPTKCDDCHAKG